MKKTFLYSVAKVVCPGLLGIYTPMKIFKKTPLPEGRVIICCNHISMADPLYIGIVHHQRQIHYMGKVELFRNKLVGGLLRGLGAFPVVRGARDMEALNTAQELLEQEEVVGIFLEGTRSKTGELLRPKTGAAMLAFQNHAPILPMCITAPRGGRVKPFQRICVSCGELRTPEDLGMYTGNSTEFRHASRMIMDEIAKMREEHLTWMDLCSKKKLRLEDVK